MALTEQKLIEFLKNTINVEEAIEADTELFSTGILDSVAMINVINYVEEVGRIEIHPSDVTLENFDTVSRIVTLANSQS